MSKGYSLQDPSLGAVALDDVRNSSFLPKVDLSSGPGAETKKYSGIVPFHAITGDDRVDRIWNK